MSASPYLGTARKRSIQSDCLTVYSWKAFMRRFRDRRIFFYSHLNHSLSISKVLVRAKECHEWSVFSSCTNTAEISGQNYAGKWRNMMSAHENRFASFDYFLRVDVRPPLDIRPADSVEELLCVIESVCCCWFISSRTCMVPSSESWASETASAESKSLFSSSSNCCSSSSNLLSSSIVEITSCFAFSFVPLSRVSREKYALSETLKCTSRSFTWLLCVT